VTEADGRAAIVTEALSWIATPYHHGARLKGVGVDCAQFVLAVYAGVGLIPDFDPEAYPHDWHLHRDAERYMTQVERFAHEVAICDIKPGDVMLFKFGRAFSHGAIVTKYPQVIHAVLSSGSVTLGDADRDHDLIGRPVRAYSIWS
jgi:cell wall-associated NlpC family hydrolase